MKNLICGICTLSLHLVSTLAANEGANDIPDYIFRGKLKTIRGHEQGYLRPREGDSIVIDFANLTKLKGLLRFGNTVAGTQDVFRYVPIPGSFKVVDVEGRGNRQEWASFRVVADEGKHRVTFDAIRHPGRGHSDFTKIWIIIERRHRVVGILEIEGKIYEAGEAQAAEPKNAPDKK